MDISSLSIAGSMGGISEPSNFTFRQLSPAAKKLFWRLNGPLESAIQVASSQYHEPDDILEPYFRHATADLAPSWHPVSQESLLEPPISTVKVRVECIDSWEALWVELNHDCIDTDNHPSRPQAKHIQLDVTAGDKFLTVHEYVSAVHPWLMGMRDEILEALGRSVLSSPLASEANMAVLLFGNGPVSIGHEKRWYRFSNKPSLAPPELSPVDSEEQARRVRERLKARSAARIRDLEGLDEEGRRRYMERLRLENF